MDSQSPNTQLSQSPSPDPLKESLHRFYALEDDITEFQKQIEGLKKEVDDACQWTWPIYLVNNLGAELQEAEMRRENVDQTHEQVDEILQKMKDANQKSRESREYWMKRERRLREANQEFNERREYWESRERVVSVVQQPREGREDSEPREFQLAPMENESRLLELGNVTGSKTLSKSLWALL